MIANLTGGTTMPPEWTSAVALPVTLTLILMPNSIFTRAVRLAWWHPRPCRTCCPRWRQCCRDLLWAKWERIYGIISPDHRRNHITDKASFVTSTYHHLSNHNMRWFIVLLFIYTGSMIRTPAYLVFLWWPALFTTCKFYIFICFVLIGSRTMVPCFRQFDIWIITLFRVHKSIFLFSSLWILVFKMKWPKRIQLSLQRRPMY